MRRILALRAGLNSLIEMVAEDWKSLFQFSNIILDTFGDGFAESFNVTRCLTGFAAQSSFGDNIVQYFFLLLL